MTESLSHRECIVGCVATEEMKSARSSCPLLRHMHIPLVAQVYLQECFVPESRWLERGCYICKGKKRIYLGALSSRIFTISPN